MLRYAAWLVLKPFLRLLEMLPLEFELAAAPIIGTITYLLNRRLVRRAVGNLELAFAGKFSRAERKRIVRGYYANAFRCLFEFLHFPHLRPGRIRGMVRGGRDFIRRVNDALRGGKGCIFLTGHVNNWELLGAFIATHWPVSVIGKKIYFEPYNEAIVSRRAGLGYRTIYQDEPPRRLLAALRRNETVGILPDQDMPRIDGIFIDFFGKSAFTPTAPVSLARASGAPILVAFMIRRGSAHRIISFEPFHVPREGDKEAIIRKYTEKWSVMEEKIISLFPEQWPWIHRRWKTRP